MPERIRLSGRLNADGQFILRPAFPTSIPGEEWQRDRQLLYVVEVLDAESHLLVRAPLAASVTPGVGTIVLRGSVDLPEDAARIVILSKDPFGSDPRVLAAEAIPDQAPRLRLLDVPEHQVDGHFTLSWEALGDPPAVKYFVDYSTAPETWEPLSLGTTEPRLTINFGTLAGGDACRLAVTASNGFRTTRVVSDPFQVQVKPCVAIILRPADGAELSSNVTLVGTGWWREEGRAEAEELSWESDVQGELGRGNELTVQLEPGTHRITLRAGTGDRAGTESAAVHVA